MQDLTVAPLDHSGFDALTAALGAVPAWVPFVGHIEKTRDQANSLQCWMASELMGWAKQYLGPDYAHRLAEGYVRFVSDVNIEQMRYERRGHYRNKSFAEVYEATYNSEAFMNGYHWGVFASTFAWSHHLDVYERFHNQFLRALGGQTKAPRLLDLGCGSGLWSMLSLTELTAATADSVDISATSVKETTAMKDALGFGVRMTVHQGDALSWTLPGADTEPAFDAGISCFVLEHLEQPILLLKNLARNIKPRGLAFVTAALTAAEVDHIYEFKRESEVIQMAEEAGFRVIESASLSPGGYREDGKFLPRSMSMVLSRRVGDVW